MNETEHQNCLERLSDTEKDRLIARLWGVDPGKQTSLMFGLGMNNNGTGLVLASLALADHPKVMIPIIFYNLVQQVFAGYVHWTSNRDSFDRNGPERDR